MVDVLELVRHRCSSGIHPTHLHPNEQKRSPGTPVRNETAMNGAPELWVLQLQRRNPGLKPFELIRLFRGLKAPAPSERQQQRLFSAASGVLA